MERPGFTGAGDTADFALISTPLFDVAAEQFTSTARRTHGEGVGKIESLEQRRMLSSVSLVNGELRLWGNTSSRNTLGVYASGNKLIAVHNGATKTVAASSVGKIVIYGGSKDDNLWITSEVRKASVIRGYKGNDALSGGSGKDWLYGGDGADKLWGNKGNDWIDGDGGNDSLRGGSGDDKLDGGSGSDNLLYDSYNPGSDNSNGGSTGGSTGSNSNASSPKPVITAVTDTTIPVGTAFHANAMSSSLGTGTPLTTRYQWDFGDKGSYYNTLQGFNAGHLYERSGKYTVRLTITNAAGKTSSVTRTITVTAANRKIYYVSSGGSDSNDGSSSRPFKSFAKAMSLVRDNTEIRFRRGDTFNVSLGATIKDDNVVITAYGSSSKNPVLKFDGPRNYGVIFRTDERGKNVTISSLTFDSIYSGASNEDGLPSAIRPDARNTTIAGNQFLNVGFAINGNQNPNGLLVMNNSAPLKTGLKGYFAWVQGNDHVYVGNKVANAYAHVLRVVGGNRLLIANNDFTNPSEGNGVRGTVTIHKGSYVYVARNTFIDGAVAIGPLGEGDGMKDKSGRWTWGVFESNVIKSGVDIVHGASKIMFRNNVLDRDGNYAIKVDGWNSTYGRGVQDVTIANNTVFNDSSKGNFVKFEGEVPGTTVTNNLYVAPKLVTGSWNTAPLLVYDNDLSGFDFIGNNVWADANPIEYAQGGMNYVWPSWSNASGYKTPSEWNAYGVVSNDRFADTSLNGWTPSSGSAAATAARAISGVFTDIHGKARPSSGTWTAGAVQR